jgi:uncharacterized DUF497 family protein
VEYGYDPGKNAWNIRERGLSFAEVATLDWEGAIVRRDTRKDYGEDRYQALADGLDGKPYVVVFTMREDTMWIISFRRAHEKERPSYGKKA